MTNFIWEFETHKSAFAHTSHLRLCFSHFRHFENSFKLCLNWQTQLQLFAAFSLCSHPNSKYMMMNVITSRRANDVCDAFMSRMEIYPVSWHQHQVLSQITCSLRRHITLFKIYFNSVSFIGCTKSGIRTEKVRSLRLTIGSQFKFKWAPRHKFRFQFDLAKMSKR